MEAAVKSHLFRIFSKYNFEQSDASFLSDLFDEIDSRQSIKFNESKDFFLNKNDKVELIEKIANAKNDTIKWIVGIGFFQLIAIIGALIAILKAFGK
ncbi:MAG: hypothetical protein ACR2FN_05850 [Chitinophagaceae bacterium]